MSTVWTGARQRDATLAAEVAGFRYLDAAAWTLQGPHLLANLGQHRLILTTKEDCAGHPYRSHWFRGLGVTDHRSSAQCPLSAVSRGASFNPTLLLMAAHSSQNFAPSSFSWQHFGHFIMPPGWPKWFVSVAPRVIGNKAMSALWIASQQVLSSGVGSPAHIPDAWPRRCKCPSNQT